MINQNQEEQLEDLQFDPAYKTKLCIRNTTRKGCPDGADCKDAHGRSELKKLPDNYVFFRGVGPPMKVDDGKGYQTNLYKGDGILDKLKQDKEKQLFIDAVRQQQV